MPARLTVLETSARITPGLLSAAAWDLLRSGVPVFCSDGHPQRPALEAAGVAVTVHPCDAALLRAAAERDGLVWLAAADDGVAADLLVQDSHSLQCEVLVGSVDLPGARLLDAVSVMDRLRSPGGCPWDAEQTHASLAPYLLEEAYEAFQALEDTDDAGLREELGDLLLQVLFHARIAAEGVPGWTIDDVADGLVEKLVSRHPHVFGDVEVSGAEEVNDRWEQLKAEQKGRTSVTDGVPLAMAALALAAKLQRRADRLGPGPAAAFDPGAGLGAELWRRVADGGADAEVELRAVARRFRDELAGAEAALTAAGMDPAAVDPDGWRELWPR